MAGVLTGDLINRFVVGPAIGRVVGGMIGNPVDATTGRKLLLDELDFSLPGLMPIEWSRFYASDLKVDSVLGQDWVLPWEQSLLSYNGFVYLTDNQGLIHYNADKSASASQDFDGEHYAIQFDEFVNTTDETAKQSTSLTQQQ